jgi:hypothetical protein
MQKGGNIMRLRVLRVFSYFLTTVRTAVVRTTFTLIPILDSSFAMLGNAVNMALSIGFKRIWVISYLLAHSAIYIRKTLLRLHKKFYYLMWNPHINDY